MACPLAAERVWTEKAQYHDAEKKYFENLSKLLKGSGTGPVAETTVTSEIEKIEMEAMAADQAANFSKSPVKKIRKNNKKDKKEAPPPPSLSPPLGDEQFSSISTVSNISAEVVAQTAPPKAKAKKDKSNKFKQLNKLNATNEAVVAVAPDAAEVIENCPFKMAIDSVKAKKQRKREKKQLSKDEGSVSDDLPSIKSTTDNKVAHDCPATKVKDTKEKKTKSDKSKLDINQKDEVQAGGECTLVSEIAKARQHIKNSLERMDGIAALASTPGKDVLERISNLERENTSLRDIVEQLKKASLQSEDRIKQLESRLQSLSLGSGVASSAAASKPVVAVAPAAANKGSDDDDGVDLFGSDSEEDDDSAAKIREARLAEYASKKAKKPALIAKSNIILDVKPWDDETDMKQMEVEVRKITQDGLLWGAAKLVPLAFGIHKLQISCVVEDDKVSIDWLQEEIEKNEDFVQSVDIAAFNKI